MFGDLLKLWRLGFEKSRPEHGVAPVLLLLLLLAFRSVRNGVELQPGLNGERAAGEGGGGGNGSRTLVSVGWP